MDFPKYTRFGYTDQERNSDELLATFLAEVPGDGYLPSRWRYFSHNQFLNHYGHLGTVLWSASASAHLLVVGGTKVLRIWTDAASHCWVEGHTNILTILEPLVMIPPKNIKKSKPFISRVKITSREDIYALAKRVQMVYGI